MFSLESPHRGDSNEYTQYTIFNIKRKITLEYHKSVPMGFFQGTQARVQNSHVKRAISVRATEVLLYMHSKSVYFSLPLSIVYVVLSHPDVWHTTADNKMTLVTLHVYRKSWNDAQSVCVSQGGILFREDSTEKKIVLAEYLSMIQG